MHEGHDHAFRLLLRDLTSSASVYLRIIICKYIKLVSIIILGLRGMLRQKLAKSFGFGWSMIHWTTNHLYSCNINIITREIIIHLHTPRMCCNVPLANVGLTQARPNYILVYLSPCVILDYVTCRREIKTQSAETVLENLLSSGCTKALAVVGCSLRNTGWASIKL